MRFAIWQVGLILAALAFGIFLALPNVLPAKYLEHYPTGSLKLGLDLRGGASVLLEVDPDDLKANRLKSLSGEIREILQRPPALLHRREVVGQEVVVRVTDPAKQQEALDRLGKLNAGGIGQTAGKRFVVTPRGGGQIAVSLTQTELDRLLADAIANSQEAVRRRVDATGAVEPNIQKQGASRIIVEVPGLSDPTSLIDVLTRAGVLTFNMVDVEADPSKYELNVPSNGRIKLANGETGQQQVVFEDPVITGQDLSRATQAFDQSGRPAIEFGLKPAGAQRFGRATTNNVGKPFAIVLDNEIVSAPNIHTPIMTGSGQITGDFTVERANNLASILRAGALPAKLRVAEKRVVDASLGADSIRAGVTASVIGLILVAVFMIAAYGLLGIFSVIALLFNIVLLIGVLSGLGATLTLPGIAGIILTIGMAVDANVLVFERIREEKRNGRSPVSSVDVGYHAAQATIFDANATHFLAGMIMFFLGSGPVRGFALTLVIGIISSFFTAVVVARWIMSVWLFRVRPKAIPI